VTTGSCVLTSKAADKKKLSNIYQRCWTINAIQYNDCSHCKNISDEDVMISCFPSLNYCYSELHKKPTCMHIVQDLINNCVKLKYFSLLCSRFKLSLNLAHNQNLQQLYISASHTEVPDEFMTSVSAYGGLVHVAMEIRSLTTEGITSLVKNSPKLITFYLSTATKRRWDVEIFNNTLKKMFCKRKLFTAGHYQLCTNVHFNTGLWEQGTNVLPLWK